MHLPGIRFSSRSRRARVSMTCSSVSHPNTTDWLSRAKAKNPSPTYRTRWRPFNPPVTAMRSSNVSVSMPARNSPLGLKESAGTATRSRNRSRDARRAIPSGRAGLAGVGRPWRRSVSAHRVKSRLRPNRLRGRIERDRAVRILPDGIIRRRARRRPWRHPE